MLKLLAFLWTGCWHRWKVIDTSNRYDLDVTKEMRAGVNYRLQCERCGDVKLREL